MKTRLLSILAAFVVSALVGLAFWKNENSRQIQYRLRARQRVIAKAGVIRSKLEFGINRRLALAEGLAAYATIRPDITQKEFESFARTLVGRDTVVLRADLAKDNVISHVYPLEGNEKAIGFEILNDKNQGNAAERAMVSRLSVVAGPYALTQSGAVFIGRMPVFFTIKKPVESKAYWGLTDIMIRQEGLFKESGLSAESGNVRYALRGRDGRGDKGGVFFGNGDLFTSRPVLLDVALQNGSWQLAAVPVGGLPTTAPGSWKFRLFGFLVTVVMGILVFFFVESWFPRSRPKY